MLPSMVAPTVGPLTTPSRMVSWLETGIRQLEAYLEKHAAFLAYLDTAEQH